MASAGRCARRSPVRISTGAAIRAAGARPRRAVSTLSRASVRHHARGARALWGASSGASIARRNGLAVHSSARPAETPAAAVFVDDAVGRRCAIVASEDDERLAGVADKNGGEKLPRFHGFFTAGRTLGIDDVPDGLAPLARRG